MGEKKTFQPAVIAKAIIKGTLELKSPMMIASGDSENDKDSLVIKNKEGVPYIPGTSITGVLRSLMKAMNPEYEKFFGDKDKYQSSIVIGDIVLENTQIVIRDGVSIDNALGVAKGKAKYNYELVERGAYGNFEIVVTKREYQNVIQQGSPNKKSDNSIEMCIYNMIQTLYTGISLGGKTTSGFGKVVAKEIKNTSFDFSKREDVKDWFLGEIDKRMEQVENKEITPQNDFVLEGCFELKSSLLVRTKDFLDYDIKLTDKSSSRINVQMQSNKEYVIPGPTVKGVIRNHAYKICKAMGKSSVDDILDDLFGYAKKDSYNKKGDEKSDIEQVKGKKGQLIAEEIYVAPKTKKLDLGAKQTRNRLDRFSGGTVGNALFTNVPIWKERDCSKVKMRIVIKNYKDWQAGLLLFVLKDLWTGQVAFGGEKSSGKGTLKGSSANLIFHDKNIELEGQFDNLSEEDKKELQKLADAFVKVVKP